MLDVSSTEAKPSKKANISDSDETPSEEATHAEMKTEGPKAEAPAQEWQHWGACDSNWNAWNDWGRGWGYWYNDNRWADWGNHGDGWGWAGQNQRNDAWKHTTWGGALSRPATCDLFAYERTPHTKPNRSPSGKTDQPNGQSNKERGDKMDEDQAKAQVELEEEEKKKAELKKAMHAKYMRFYRSLASPSP